jgi:hypothetical protein
MEIPRLTQPSLAAEILDSVTIIPTIIERFYKFCEPAGTFQIIQEISRSIVDKQ